MASRFFLEKRPTTRREPFSGSAVKRPITFTLVTALIVGVLAPGCALVAVMFFKTENNAEQLTSIAKTELKSRCLDQLVAVREIKKTQIEDFFSRRLAELRVLAGNPHVRQAFKELDAALDAGGGFEGGRFRGNGNGRFDAPPEYTAVHDKYFPAFKHYVDQYDYSDFYLLCVDHGDVSFSVKKGADFGQRTDEIDSSLHDVWRIAAKAGRVALSDTRPYAPSGDAPAQFLAAPIRENGRVIGIVALRVSIDAINRILAERSGMGRTGETYLVGSDKLMRSDAFLDPENRSVAASFRNPIKGSVDTEASNAALRGEASSALVVNYDGKRVLSAYTPVDLPGLRWALLAEIDETEAFAPIVTIRKAHEEASQSLLTWTSVLCALCFLSLVLVGLGVYWKIARPIRRMASAAVRAAEGDLDVQMGSEGKSEVAVLSRAFDQKITNLRSVMKQADAIAKGDFSADIRPRCDKDALGLALAKMTETLRHVATTCEAVAGGDYSVEVPIKGEKDLLGKALNKMITKLKSVTEQINSAGSRMVSASREQAEGARNQSTATEEMSSTVSELLASAKKMMESGASVAKQAELAAKECAGGTTSVESAVEGIRGIHERVEKIAAHMLELGSKSQQISGVLDIIAELSEQTNLLSLNASIEAAGAGEAGKRFAVVASEIRKLAERATDSTGEIRSLIDSIQETVNSTIMATEEGTKAVQDGVRLTEEVDKSFERIAGQLEEWSGRKETDPSMLDTLAEYWDSVGWTGWGGDTSIPWSAAFISWIQGGDFPGASSHRK
ncbi:MAG: methyl-accepting chemotaxis protein, partial [Phycisphaerae bacterium]